MLLKVCGAVIDCANSCANKLTKSCGGEKRTAAPIVTRRAAFLCWCKPHLMKQNLKKNRAGTTVMPPRLADVVIAEPITVFSFVWFSASIVLGELFV